MWGSQILVPGGEEGLLQSIIQKEPGEKRQALESTLK